MKKKKKANREREVFGLVVFLFVIGFMYLCQHMSVIRLGYALGKEKEVFKELSTLNMDFRLESASLKSPRNLTKAARVGLGLDAGAGVVRRINVVSPQKKHKNENKFVRKIDRFFGFNSNALARPSLSDSKP